MHQSITKIYCKCLCVYAFYYSKKREVVPDLAPMLWHSFGTVAALLQEIVHVYPAINPPHLTVSSFYFFTNITVVDFVADI